MKKLWIFSSLLLAVLIWQGEARKFYCLGTGQCVTVWKTYNNVCYVIPGKYDGLIKPADNYLQTTNRTLLTLYFAKELPRAVIVQCLDGVAINNRDSGAPAFYRYETDTGRFLKLLYPPDSKKRSEMKQGAGLMDIDIHEGYALDKDGKGL